MIYTIYIEIKKTNEKLKKKNAFAPIYVWLNKIGCPAINIV